MALVPIDQYKKSAPRQQTFGKLKPLAPKPARVASAVQRPDIRQSENYRNAISNADKYLQEANKASSFRGMATNALKSVPQATADVLVGTPAKFIASAIEVPEVAYKGKFTDRTYKVPGLTPFKSFQSDYGKVADEVIAGNKGLGSAAWELAKIPLAGLETGVSMGGVAKGAKLLLKGNIKGAGAVVSDAFLPTNFSQKLNPLPTRNTGYSKNLGTDPQELGQGIVQEGKTLQTLPNKELPTQIQLPEARVQGLMDGVASQKEDSYFMKPMIDRAAEKVKNFYPQAVRSGEKSLTNQGLSLIHI